MAVTMTDTDDTLLASIYAESCEDKFRQIPSLIQRFKLKVDTSSQEIINEGVRFMLWAETTGALSGDPSPLDFQLMFLPSLREATILSLQSLSSALSHRKICPFAVSAAPQ